MTAVALTYDVIRTVPEAVRHDLCRLWQKNLHLDQAPEKRFRWLYEEAPQPADSVFVLKVNEQASPVGTLGLALRQYQLGSRQVLASINGNLAVDQEHRGLLPALRLIKAARDHAVAEHAVSYGFPNKKAEGVMIRAGFKVLDKTTRYVRVLEHASYAARVAERLALPPKIAAFVTRKEAAAILGPIADVGRLSLNGPRFAKAVKEFHLELPAKIDTRFDALWDAAKSEYEIVGARTSAFLAWRFAANAEIAALVRRKDKSIAAYAVIERDETTRAAHLRDVFGHKDALGPLIDRLLPALWRRGCASVSVRFVGAPDFLDAIKAREFEARDERRTIVVQAGKNETEQRARIEDPRAWHLFDADEDM